MSKIAIILGYYDGEEFLNELLNSIFKQSFQSFHIFLFDDNSPKVLNLESLNLSKENRERITIHRREKNIGFANNFLNGLKKVDMFFDFYAFCDQDDIWMTDKLSRAIGKINQENTNLPLIYGTKTLHIDKTGKSIIGESINISKELSFKNALIQSFAGGNTMVFNHKAKELIVSSLRDISPASHDWWAYILITGNGGKVIYDSEYSLFYRQHDKNSMGSNKTLSGKFKRFFKIFNSEFQNYINHNLEALHLNSDLLTQKNYKIMRDFSKARKYNFLKKSIYYLSSGLYRQNYSGSFLFFIFFIIGKI